MNYRRISIVTSVLPTKADFLSETYESIVQQQLPEGWDIEWLLRIDGRSDDLEFSSTPHVAVRRHCNDRNFGPAVSRTLALGDCSGDLVKILDGDDVLTLGQLTREIEVFESEPQVQWVTSRVLDLLPDGSLEGFEGDPPEGVLLVNSVYEYWRTHNFRASVHPATLTMRRDALLFLGGWMALPTSEDTGLLMGLNALWPGYFLSEPGLLYRKWPKQLTATEAHQDEVAKKTRFDAINKRVRAIQALKDSIS